jgi:hypothetical protein
LITEAGAAGFATATTTRVLGGNRAIDVKRLKKAVQWLSFSLTGRYLNRERFTSDGSDAWVC